MRTAYLLSYNPSADRTKFSYELLSKIGFNVKIVKTIDNDCVLLSNRLSFEYIYNLILNSNDYWGYVFEDDINLIEDISLNEIIEYENISNYFFYLGCCCKLHDGVRKTKHTINGHDVYSISGNARCLHAIGISKQGARTILNLSKAWMPYEPTKFAFDNLFDDFTQSNPTNIVRYDLKSSQHENHRGVLFQDRIKFSSDIDKLKKSLTK